MAENIKENHFKEHPGRKYFTRQIEYWKKRCELAEEVIEIWEPEHYPNNSWTLWMNFRSSGDVAVFLPRPVIDAPDAMPIPHPMHDNFRAKYPLEEMKGKADELANFFNSLDTEESECVNSLLERGLINYQKLKEG